jgi:hypothetical protein
MALLLIATVVACAHPDDVQSTSHSWMVGHVTPGPIIRVGRGVRCITQQDGWQTPVPSTMIEPLTYAAADAGKPGVPPLTRSERHMLHRIEHYVHSSTLRFAWVEHATPPRHFIIYDADRGLCVLANAPYKVLNGGCNEYYGSGEYPFDTKPAPDCFGTRPPWMTPPPR